MAATGGVTTVSAESVPAGRRAASQPQSRPPRRQSERRPLCAAARCRPAPGAGCGRLAFQCLRPIGDQARIAGQVPDPDPHLGRGGGASPRVRGDRPGRPRGRRPARDFCQTLTVTDVLTGWTETRAVRNKAPNWVFAALGEITAAFAFSSRASTPTTAVSSSTLTCWPTARRRNHSHPLPRRTQERRLGGRVARPVTHAGLHGAVGTQCGQRRRPSGRTRQGRPPTMSSFRAPVP